MTLTRFSSVVTHSTAHTADCAAADMYHAFKDVKGFAKVASLAEIRANDGNLSIPLYVRGKAVSEEKGEYAADGLRAAVKAWEESSEKLDNLMHQLMSTFEN
jgi:type I restriction enzyme M protein